MYILTPLGFEPKLVTCCNEAALAEAARPRAEKTVLNFITAMDLLQPSAMLLRSLEGDLGLVLEQLLIVLGNGSERTKLSTELSVTHMATFVDFPSAAGV